MTSHGRGRGAPARRNWPDRKAGCERVCLLLVGLSVRLRAVCSTGLINAQSGNKSQKFRETRSLPKLFMGMATQNPLEQAGTYPLPEARLDRFMLHVTLSYPTPDEEFEILQRDRAGSKNIVSSIVHTGDILQARDEVRAVHIDPMLERYIVTLVGATRSPGKWHEASAEMIEIGASPRASLALVHAARACAYLRGRGFDTPQDIQYVALDCFRHRIIPSFAARMQSVSRDTVLRALVDAVPVP